MVLQGTAMKKLLILLISLCASALVFAAPAKKPADADKDIHTYTLPNGLQLIVKEDHRAPVVISEIWYKVGGSYEPDGITGISHMLEHMMFQGTSKYPEGVLARLIDENGGKMNAMTTADYTMYYQKLANDKLSLSFKLESDRMRNLNLQQKNYDKEKQVVINERRMRTENDPQSTTFERFNAAAFLGNPYYQPVVGWMSDLQNMQLEDVRNWYNTWYAPNNAIVVVVGDVEPEKVYQLAQQYFGPLKPQTLPAVKPHGIIKALGQKFVNVNMPAKLPFLLIGYNVPAHTTQPKSWEPYALEVLAAILGQDDSSRLAKNLIRGNEIATSADVGYSLYSRLPGLFIFAAVPAQSQTVSSLKEALFDQVKQLQTSLVTEKELSRVKTKLVANKTYKLDSISAQASDIGSLVAVGLPWEEADNYYRQIEQVTAQQVQDVAKKYLVQEAATIAVLTPKNIVTNVNTKTENAQMDKKTKKEVRG